MQITIQGIETTLATFFSKAKADIQAAAAEFLKIVPKIDEAAPTVEALTALVSPTAANWEKVAVSLLDKAAAAVNDVAPGGSASLTLSPDIVADVQALIAAAKNAGAQVKAS